MKLHFKKTFLYFWSALWILGSLNSGIFPKFFNLHLDLPLHLKYGQSMFTVSIEDPQLFDYSETKDGHRYPISDLVQTPSIGYLSSRVNLNILYFPDYLNYLCKVNTGMYSPPLYFHLNRYGGTDFRPMNQITYLCSHKGIFEY